jgi:glycosyltransferase involved in cell wall biosynthesis
MMRLLLATDAWAPQINGVVRTLEELVRRGPQNGLDIRIVSPDLFRTVGMPGYPEIRLALAPGRAIARVMREWRPDAVHVATEGPIGIAARRASIDAGISLTTSYHTRFPEYLRARLPVPPALSYAWLRRFHSGADAVLCATSSLETDLRQRGFRRLVRWSRGVDLSMFRPLAARVLELPRPIFLNVGRVAAEKNLEAFLSLDLPGSRVIVGDGPARPALQRRFPDAAFLGALSGCELAAVYASADVFVFPSRTDTFGLVIVEALASGLPVAAYPVMGPRDIVTSPKVGVLSEDLRAAALHALTLDGRDCRAFAESFSWDASAAQFAQAVREAVAHRQRLKAEADDLPPGVKVMGGTVPLPHL